jgi:DNA-binding transcriptional LysR family regulator
VLRLPVLRQHEGVVLHELFANPCCWRSPLGIPGGCWHVLEQLKEERFISIPHRDRGGLSYLSASLCMEAGFFPQAAQVLSRKTTQLQLIQAGFGVALLPRCMRDIAPASVSFVALEGDCQSTVALACRRDGGR